MISAAEFSRRLKSYPDPTPPGLKIWVQKKGRTVFESSWGKTWEHYDLASLTKIFFTTTAFMRAVQEHGLKLSSQVSEFLPTKSQVNLSQFLNHTSGLVAWEPYYKDADFSAPLPWRWEVVKERILAGVPDRASDVSSVYSDLNFFVLGMVLEEFHGCPLLQIFTSLQREGWVSDDLHFNPLSAKPREPLKSYAPTEDCPWRKKVLRGEVHDDNAWSLGGVAPHAGLFGSMAGVKEMASLWRDVLTKKRHSHPLEKATLKKFIQRSVPANRGDFGLGFMLPTRGRASCGNHFSAKAFGHTGFTGTSLWMDPEKDQIAVILSNRVHPRRDSVDFKKFRPWVHDLALNSL